MLLYSLIFSYILPHSKFAISKNIFAFLRKADKNNIFGKKPFFYASFYAIIIRIIKKKE